MTHVIHDCKAEGADAIVQMFKDRYGWGLDEMPLNIARNTRTGESRHPTCPYCGEDTADMEAAPMEETAKLNTDPRGSGYGRRPQAQYKNENVEILKELKDLRKEFAALKKKGGSD